jgi:hypothetical protein
VILHRLRVLAQRAGLRPDPIQEELHMGWVDRNSVENMHLADLKSIARVAIELREQLNDVSHFPTLGVEKAVKCFDKVMGEVMLSHEVVIAEPEPEETSSSSSSPTVILGDDHGL